MTRPQLLRRWQPQRVNPSSLPGRFARWLRAGPTGLVLLALLIGAGAGAGAVAFRYLILGFTYLFSGYRDYSAAGRAPYGFDNRIGWWFVLLAPVAGGLLYGPLVSLFAPETRGHGVPEVMLAVTERGGRIRPRVAVVKSLASALCLGSGGSVGREGPIVQIGSALGSTLGQITRMSESRLRILVACGAAGGISATFNAPIAGTFFALELILRDFEAESFGVVVLSSFIADIIGRAAFGSHPFLHLPAFQLRSPVEYLLYAGLGVAAALVGIAFIRVLYGSEDLADRIWRGPEWLRPALGGLLLGLLLLALPQLYGVGYPPLEKAIGGGYIVWLLLALLAGKVLATSLTIAIGGSGGVFAPSLFMGAMLGSAYGTGMHHLLPSLTGPAGAYGLVGMGAVFAAAARAPITAVIIIFELTGDYQVILPLMFAIAVAAGISTLLTEDTIYTLKLRRRGIDIRRGRGANLMQLITVADSMQPPSTSIHASTALNELIATFTDTTADSLPVIDSAGVYQGTLTLRQLEQAMRENALDATAGDLAEPLPTLTPDQSLEQALTTLLRTHTGVPVLDHDRGQVVGWLTHTNVLDAYNRRLEQALEHPPATATETTKARPQGERPLSALRRLRLVDLELTPGAAPVGRQLGELPWPHSARILAVARSEQTLKPRADLRLERGDRLTVLLPSTDADALADVLTDSCPART